MLFITMLNILTCKTCKILYLLFTLLPVYSTLILESYAIYTLNKYKLRRVLTDEW